MPPKTIGWEMYEVLGIGIPNPRPVCVIPVPKDLTEGQLALLESWIEKTNAEQEAQLMGPSPDFYCVRCDVFDHDPHEACMPPKSTQEAVLQAAGKVQDLCTESLLEWGVAIEKHEREKTPENLKAAQEKGQYAATLGHALAKRLGRV